MLVFAGACVVPLIARSAAQPGLEKLPDGIRLQTATGFLTLQIKTDAIVRVTFARNRTFRADPMVVVGPADAQPPRWTLSSNARTITVATARIRASISRSDGSVTFTDAGGRIILAETPGGRHVTPAVVQGETTLTASAEWRPINACSFSPAPGSPASSAMLP
jgi:alpha-D-xyloside xylohydrolase